jgi:heptosyltransferase-3
MSYGLSDNIDFAQVKKVLVVKLRHHGDVLLTSPLFQVLKNHHPHLQVDALVYEETRPMLEHHPAIHLVYGIDRTWRKQGIRQHLGHERGLVASLKAQQYDVLIHLTESWRGAILSRFIHPTFSIVRQYSRRRSRLWMNSFTHHYPIPSKPRHTVEVHLDALRRIGLQPSMDERKLVVEAGEEATQSLESKIKNNGVHGDYIVIHPTSRWLFKCWSIDAVADTIESLSKAGHTVVLSAAPDKKEQAMMADITKRLTCQPVDLSGQLSLYELIALIKGAKLFIGVDSVPMHLAAATGTPLVALFGPSGDLEWGPWQAKGEVITSDAHSCRPCGMDGCAGSKVSDCLQQISYKRVLLSVNRLLEQSTVLNDPIQP